jgi:hypothetical protein
VLRDGLVVEDTSNFERALAQLHPPEEVQGSGEAVTPLAVPPRTS